MAKRRVIRRKTKSPVASNRPGFAVPTTKQSFGLGPEEDCQILVVGGANYCSFTLARLGRLGISGQVAITNSENHAIWAVSNLSPGVVIASVDHERKSGGIDLMRKLEAVNPDVAVILTSSAMDNAVEPRTLLDLAYSMSETWSFVTRRKTDNGDPLGVAVVTAQQGVGWIDYPVREQLEKWRTAKPSTRSVIPVAA